MAGREGRQGRKRKEKDKAEEGGEERRQERREKAPSIHCAYRASQCVNPTLIVFHSFFIILHGSNWNEIGTCTDKVFR
jgi:hypothetical protein